MHPRALGMLTLREKTPASWLGFDPRRRFVLRHVTTQAMANFGYRKSRKINLYNFISKTLTLNLIQ